MTQAPDPILLFPTHYLGNFVLGLPWVLRVLQTHPGALVVLDSRFASLASQVLDDSVERLYYPRDKLARNQPLLGRLRHYRAFLRQLRARPEATLLDLEGERFTGVLSWLSGCKARIGPTGKHAGHFYTRALELDYQKHRFNAFGQVCADFASGQASPRLHYRIDAALEQSLDARLGAADKARPWIAIHPGASVAYKLWPRDYFLELAETLERQGYQLFWVGAGAMDAQIISAIRRRQGGSTALNLCNRLSLSELAALYLRCTAFIGSDSGPMHLAASTGVTVLALFGPSREAIWAPLGANSRVLRGELACASDCDAFHCDFDYHCLSSLRPGQVLSAIQNLVSDPAHREA